MSGEFHVEATLSSRGAQEKLRLFYRYRCEGNSAQHEVGLQTLLNSETPSHIFFHMRKPADNEPQEKHLLSLSILSVSVIYPVKKSLFKQ
jgi:hypothetical protein